jgi:hypothetical protein
MRTRFLRVPPIIRENLRSMSDLPCRRQAKCILGLSVNRHYTREVSLSKSLPFIRSATLLED